MSSKELAEVNQEIDSRAQAFNECTVFGGMRGTMTSPLRSSLEISLAEEDPLTIKLHKAIDQGLYDYTCSLMERNPCFSRWPLPCGEGVHVFRERIQILRYKPGDRYVWHHDTDDRQSQPEYHRVFSTVLYLNDTFEGGGTSFMGKTYKPLPGEALFFPSNWCFPHEGQEVTSGEKRVAVTWWHSVLNA